MKTIICTQCNRPKQPDEMKKNSRRPDGYASICKRCSRQAVASWMQKTREANNAFIWKYKSEHPCIVCGESDPVVLDFHHRDPKHKHKAVSFLRFYAKLDKIECEISKCDVLCANDHRRLHSAQMTKSAELALRT